MSYLGLANASVTTRLSSPPRLVPPSSSSSFLVFFLRLFRAAQRKPGPVTGRETADECKAGFIHLCQGGVVAEAVRAAGADVVRLLKI